MVRADWKYHQCWWCIHYQRSVWTFYGVETQAWEGLGVGELLPLKQAKISFYSWLNRVLFINLCLFEAHIVSHREPGFFWF